MVVSYYPNPRKGTETAQTTEIIINIMAMSYYPNPRKGTETIRHRSDQNLNLGRRITRIPVRGLKQLHVFIYLEEFIIESYYPNPRKGTETFHKEFHCFQRTPVVLPKSPELS